MAKFKTLSFTQTQQNTTRLGPGNYRNEFTMTDFDDDVTLPIAFNSEFPAAAITVLSIKMQVEQLPESVES